MNSSDAQKIAAWKKTLECSVAITAVLGTDDKSARLGDFCDQLAELAPAVTIDRAEDTEGDPGLRVAPNIFYQAVPEDRELDVFLDLLGDTLKPAGGAIRPLDTARLARLDSPVHLAVYISPQCPFCPLVVSALLICARTSGRVRVNLIDGTLFSEQAQTRDIKAVPTVILNNGFRWTGQVDVNEIMDVAVSGADADFGVETLRTIVAGGNADIVAGMMLDRGRVYPAFIDLLADGQWSVRLGAMVVFEYIVENDDALAGKIVDALWERFDKVDNSVKGDILHLFGESGRTDTRQKIRSVLEEDYAPEVKETARETLERQT